MITPTQSVIAAATIQRQLRGTARIEVNGKTVDLFDCREAYENSAPAGRLCAYCRTIQTEGERCRRCGAPE